jgi:RNA polymerase-binding transcription factor DksA
MKKTQKKTKAKSKPKRSAADRKTVVKKAAKKPVKGNSSRKSAVRSTVKPASKPAARRAVHSSAKSSKKKVLCEFCGAEIPPERIEILPDTTTCVQCSQTKPYSETQIIGLNGEDTENRLNVEDFEEADTDFSISYNDQW